MSLLVINVVLSLSHILSLVDPTFCLEWIPHFVLSGIWKWIVSVPESIPTYFMSIFYRALLFLYWGRDLLKTRDKDTLYNNKGCTKSSTFCLYNEHYTKTRFLIDWQRILLCFGNTIGLIIFVKSLHTVLGIQVKCKYKIVLCQQLVYCYT